MQQRTRLAVIDRDAQGLCLESCPIAGGGAAVQGQYALVAHGGGLNAAAEWLPVFVVAAGILYLEGLDALTELDGLHELKVAYGLR